MKQYFANLPLRKKITTIIVFINVTMLGIILVFGIQLVINAFNKTVYHSTAASLSGSAYYIENTLNNVMTLSNILMADDIIQDNLSTTLLSDNDLLQNSSAQALYSILVKQQTQFNKYHIEYITLVNDKIAVDSNRLKSQMIDTSIKENIMLQAKQGSGASVWVEDYGDKNQLYLTRDIRQIAHLDLSYLGTLTIAVNAEAMIEAANRYSSPYESVSYALFSDDGYPVYIADELSGIDMLSSSFMDDALYQIVTINDHKYFVVKGILQNYHWTYFCMVPYDVIHDSIQSSYITYGFAIIITVILSIYLSTVLTRQITKHFDNLVHKMETFRGYVDNLSDLDYDYTGRTDELGLLHREFDKMTCEIHNLIHENYMKELLLKDTQLKALETQLNPHFLYNILESVNWRARAIGADKISQMVESLGRLLRGTLSKEKGLISLKQEMDFLSDYITIQQLRYEELLIFKQNIPDQYMGILIPRLLLQPLVENAIHYGLEENTDGCEIELAIDVGETDTILKVINSGSNIAPDIIEKLENNQIKPYGMGIGLLNIHQRLKMTYGNEYGLTFDNLDNHAIVCVHLPSTVIDAC